MEQGVNYVFGTFRLETATQQLHDEGWSVCLPVKVYLLLLYFLRNPGRLISRQEIFNTLWQGRVVEDVTLRFTVNHLRKALRDNSKMPQYILTVCKSGYRFLPEVKFEPIIKNVGTIPPVNIFNSSPNCLAHEPAFQQDSCLLTLLKVLESVHEGNRRLVMLNGEKGTGKSEIIDRLLASVTPMGVNSLRARCVPLNVAMDPFLPLIEALDRRCSNLCSQTLASCLGSTSPHWHCQLPRCAENKAIQYVKPDNLPSTTSRMLREGVELFENLASQSVFVLILDNAQWCDDFTLDLINFLMFRCSPAKLLIILSYRPNDADGIAVARLAKMEEELFYRGKCVAVSPPHDGLC
jgi:DNA-binding winged helix-turn-helix (wHTH) protein